MCFACRTFGQGPWHDPSLPGLLDQNAMDVFNPGADDRPPPAPSDPDGTAGISSASGPGKSALISQYYSGGRYNFSGNQDIDAALIGSKWTITNLTYSFPTSGTFYGTGYKSGENLSFTAFNTAQQSAARFALGLIGQYTPLNLSEVTESSTVHANFRFGQSGNSSVVPSAYANFPADSYYAGDIWFGQTGQPFYTTPAKGNWGFATQLHELGHAFGLKHGHQDYTSVNLAGDLGVSGTRYGSVALPSAHDGQDWSLMTYRSNPGAPVDFEGEGFNQPQSYMQDDIAALQYLYGANFNTQSGNTTYSWNPTTGEMSINGVGQGAPSSNKISMTVWDGNRTDTYDLSNYTTGLNLDLNPGAFSTFSTAQLVNHRAYSGGSAPAVGNVANALQYNGDARSLIENAIGGAGNDTILGNAANNVLAGRAGNDTINGRGGVNTAVFAFDSADYRVTRTGGTTTVQDAVAASNQGTDTLTNIRYLQFGDRTVDLQKAAKNDVNGDLRGDLVFQDGTSNTVAVWLMNGTTIGAASAVSGAYAPPGWLVKTTGDLNGDGLADMLLQNTSTGGVALWAMNGSTVQSSAVLSLTPGPDWVLVGSGDLNNDNKSDLVFQNTSTNVVAAWLMNGATITSAAGISGAYAPPGWAVKGIGDLNADGNSDLLLQNSSSGAVAVWAMSGTTALATAVLSITPGPDWRLVATGDLNGDGKSDLVFQNNSTNTVAGWLMDGATITSAAAVSGAYAPPGWNLQGAEDLNGDGNADLVLHNTNGAVAAWIMDGLTATSAAVLSISPGANWRLVGGEPGDTTNALGADAGGGSASLDSSIFGAPTSQGEPASMAERMAAERASAAFSNPALPGPGIGAFDMPEVSIPAAAALPDPGASDWFRPVVYSGWDP